MTTPDFSAVSAGTLRVQLAESTELMHLAQRLRYEVFYEEMGAHPTEAARSGRLDIDEFDAVCDHLVVIDEAIAGDTPTVVGTYRLLRPEGKAQIGHYYSEREYDLSRMLASEPRVVEVGRSCVAASHRRRAVMHLLWRGISTFIEHYQLNLLFGCASFAGSDDAAHQAALSYLHQKHLAPKEYRPVALPSLRGKAPLVTLSEAEEQAAFRQLPALVRGYIRLGAWIGEGAAIDAQYNTTDVCIVVAREQFTDKVMQHYSMRGAVV